MTEPADDGAVLLGAPDPADIGVSTGREARLDLVLAEELSVDHDLARWFLADAGKWRRRPGLPNSELDRVRARINQWEDGHEFPAEAHGETDVELVLRWRSGEELVVLIEDKVWALFQDRQAERYRARADARGGVAVLVAPNSYLGNHSKEVEIFDGAVAVEEILAHMRDRPPAADPVTVRRARWRADLLEELIRSRSRLAVVSDPDTVAFTAFCADWLAKHAPAAVPSRSSCHTAGQGWLWFESPRGLGYKASGWAKKHRAAVDLYVRDHGFTGTADELELFVSEVGCPEGFAVATDTARPPNAVLRFECEKVLPSEGAAAPGSSRERDVIEALQACAAATAWLSRYQARLSHSGS